MRTVLFVRDPLRLILFVLALLLIMFALAGCSKPSEHYRGKVTACETGPQDHWTGWWWRVAVQLDSGETLPVSVQNPAIIGSVVCLERRWGFMETGWTEAYKFEPCPRVEKYK